MKKKWSNKTSNKISIFIIVSVLILTTVLLANVTRKMLHSHAERVFYDETERIIDELDHTIMTYNQILYAQQAFFTADAPSRITYDKWNRYINKSNLFELYPGIHVISFARYVSNNNGVERFYSELEDYHDQEYTIWPEGKRSNYLLNQFVAPHQYMEVGIGFDHFSEPIRNKAAIKAKETGTITATEKITLITDNGDRGPGYIVYAPVYDHPHSGLLTTKEQREEHWYGHVLGAFYIEDIIDTKISKTNVANVEYQIYEVADETNSKAEEKLVYKSKVDLVNVLFPSSFEFTRTASLTFAGVKWNVHFNNTPYLQAGLQNKLPLIIMIAGSIISVLVLLILRTALQTRQKAEELASEMTDELNRIMNVQKAILNSTDYIIITANSDGLIKTFNRGAEKLLGYQSSEVVDIQKPDLFHDTTNLQQIASNYNIKVEAEETVTRINNEILKSGKTIEEEAIYRKKDGTSFPVKLTIKPLKNDLGDSIGILAIGHDITETKKAQKQVEEKDKLLTSIIETIPHPVFLKDLTGSYTLVNQATANLFYRNSEELIGQTAYELGIRLDEIVQIKNDEARVIDLNKPIYTTQSITIKQTGEKHWFYVVKLPLQTSTGMQILTIATDITERKWFEEELKSLRDNAIKSSQAKSEFLAMMSHEIRTPMNAIIGIADLLDDSELNEEQKEYVSIFRKSGENLLRIINDVLDFSKVEAGHITIEQREFNLKNVLSDVVHMFAFSANTKGINLNSEYSASLPVHVIGDQDRIRQIFTNIISNAVKYTDKGEISVILELEDWIDTQEFMLKCTIKDTGIGIPNDKLSTIFDSFTQVDISTTRRYGGTGLGLTIVRSLVEKMEGSIKVESKIGEGSIFTFSILLKSAIPLKQDKINRPNHNINMASQVSIKTKPEYENTINVLLVEDSLDNQLLIKAYVKKENIQIIIAENGLEAVELFKKNDFDIVLMDIQMPVMDGYTASKHIREWEKQQGLNHTPILALTAHALKEDEMKSIRAGCNAHLTKPIKKNELLQALNSFTKRE